MRRFALLVAAAWLCLGAGPARAANGQIVGVTGDQTALITVDPDGSNVNTLFAAGSRRLTDPAWSPDGNKVAVTMDGGFFSGSGIAVVDAVTRRVTVLTEHPQGVADSLPSWSPDGSRIAFMRSDGSVRTIKPDGSDETTLPALAGLLVTWGPDGRFAFFDNGAVGVIAADGSGRRDLAPGRMPQWSPDGSRIVYTGATGELRAAPVAGGASTAVSTPAPDPDTVFDVDPDAAPDGDGVVFTSSGFADHGTLIEDSHGRRQLKRFDLAQPDWQPCTAQTVHCTSMPFPGHPALPVTATNGQIAAIDASTLFAFNPDPSATGEKALFTDPGRALDDPEWSPDGNHIAFVDAALNGDSPRLMRYDLADGSVHTLVQDTPVAVPSWSPDGTRIFVSVRGGFMSVRAADGGDRRSYPDFPRFAFGTAPLSMGPDGRFAYSSAGDLGVFEADGTNRNPLTTTGSTTPPGWSPDGRRLVFIDDHGDTATIPADGGPVTVVGAGFYGDQEPEFSPDGHAMVLGHYQSGYGAAIELDAAEGGSRRVVVPHGHSPSWQPCVAGVTVSCVATGHAGGGGGGGDDIPVCISPITVATPRDTPLDLPPAPCTDRLNAPLTITVLDGPAHGTLTAPDAAGHRRFTPARGFVGADVIHYVASNGAHQSEVATVNIAVTGARSAPAPRLRVVSAFRLAHGRVSGRVRCDVAARLTLRLNARGKLHRWTLRAGRPVTLRLAVPRRWRHRKLSLTGTVTDAAGHRAKVTIRVKRR